MNRNFSAWIRTRQEKLGHALCVGLDPDPDNIPDKYGSYLPKAERVYNHMKDVVDQTAQHATAFKPQVAYYERHGAKGLRTLERLIGYIRQWHGDVPIILDCKRGDIDRTQAQYREAVFGHLDVDAANVSPYMGREPLINMHDPKHPHRGIITLIYTSNPGAREVQDVTVIHPGTGEHMPYWRYIAERSIAWAEEAGIQNLGFVMAAAHKCGNQVYSGHLQICRELDQGSVFYLMPGFGTQRGFVEASVNAAWTGWGSVAMNASSSIGNVEKPSEAARVLAEQIGEVIAKKPVMV